MKRKLYTIGYSGFEINGFIDKLVSHEIECLVDVREIPISRKKGFSKNVLLTKLDEAGIAYEHYKALGSPKLLRHKVREDRNYRTFFKGVHRHLKKPDGEESITEVISTSRQLRSCLMCFCPEWEYCHRSCVVDSILEKSYFTMQHLSLGEQQQRLWTPKAA